MKCIRLVFFALLIVSGVYASSMDGQTTVLWPHNIHALLSLPRVKAYLDTIAYAEGTYHTKGYSTYFGGGYFSNFEDHPRRIMCYMSASKPLCSSAAGRYQILEKTWDRLKKDLALKDFSPKSQDTMAVALIRDMGALKYVLAGKMKHASKLLHKVWASLPDSKYDQRVVSFTELEMFYNKRMDFYQREMQNTHK